MSDNKKTAKYFSITPQRKSELDKAVKKTVKKYRKTLELLAKT